MPFGWILKDYIIHIYRHVNQNNFRPCSICLTDTDPYQEEVSILSYSTVLYTERWSINLRLTWDSECTKSKPLLRRLHLEKNTFLSIGEYTKMTLNFIVSSLQYITEIYRYVWLHTTLSDETHQWYTSQNNINTLYCGQYPFIMYNYLWNNMMQVTI